MEDAPSQADLVSSLKKHAEVLAAAALINEDSIAPTNMDVAIRGMLSRSAELLRGAVSLGNDANSTALEVVARALLENLISILWVQVDPGHPEYLKEAALVELIRMARVNLKSGKARIVSRETGEEATVEMLASDKFKNLPRRMSIEDRAAQAGVEDLYNVFYRSLSMGVHGHNAHARYWGYCLGDRIGKEDATLFPLPCPQFSSDALESDAPARGQLAFPIYRRSLPNRRAAPCLCFVAKSVALRPHRLLRARWTTLRFRKTVCSTQTPG